VIDGKLTSSSANTPPLGQVLLLIFAPLDCIVVADFCACRIFLKATNEALLISEENWYYLLPCSFSLIF